MNADVLWIAHVAATGIMTGIIWFVQLIHYPWFHDVPADRFIAYHRKYTRVMGFLVGPAMLAELITGGLLLGATSSGSIRSLLVAGLVMLGLIWLSTIALQIPCHQRLASGYDPRTHRRLVQTNWIRTIGWSARLLLLVLGPRIL